MGSVRKEGKNWYFVYDLKDENGKRKQKKIRGFKTKKEAQNALIETLNAINKGTYQEPSKITYEEHVAKWFKSKKLRMDEQSIIVYECCLRLRIIPKLGKYKLSMISLDHIQDFIDSLKEEENLSHSTIKKYLEIIRSSFAYAMERHLIPLNPSLKVKLPIEEEQELSVWHEKEFKLFLEQAKDDPCFIVFELALFTGMRQGEILGLRWKYVDFDQKSIYIRQRLSRGKKIKKGAKTKAGIRTIILPDSTIQMLKERKALIEKNKIEYGALYHDNDLVACTQHGTPLNPSNVRRSFHRLTNKAALPKIRFQDLRHTHATFLLSKGINPRIIQERLGHGDIKVTLGTYSHVLPTMQKEVAHILDQVLT